MAAPVPVAAIDLTMSDDDSIHRRGPDSCGNPHHAQILRSLRRQLHNCQQALEQATANHAQEIRAKEDIIAERQGRIVDLVARNTGQADEMRRLQAGIDALRDRLNGRGKRQKRVGCFHFVFLGLNTLTKHRHGPRNYRPSSTEVDNSPTTQYSPSRM
jgi:hypothetical protein